MSPVERIFEISQTLEQLLVDRFGATGRGLHEYTTSVQDKLPKKVVKDLRFIATIRNQVAHKDLSLAKKKLTGVEHAYRRILKNLPKRGLLNALWRWIFR